MGQSPARISNEIPSSEDFVRGGDEQIVSDSTAGRARWICLNICTVDGYREGVR